MRILPVLVVTVCSLTVGTIAYAETLYTAPMTLTGPLAADCTIVNVSDQTRTVTILPNGNPGTPVQLAPGEVTAIHVVGGCHDGGCPFYCGFAVEGGKSLFRAAMCQVDLTDAPLACLPAE